MPPSASSSTPSQRGLEETDAATTITIAPIERGGQELFDDACSLYAASTASRCASLKWIGSPSRRYLIGGGCVIKARGGRSFIRKAGRWA